MTYDLQIGRRNTVLVFTDSDAAERVASVLEEEAEHLFQADGVIAVVESARDYEPEQSDDPAAAIWGLNIPDVMGAIKAVDNAESARHILEAEEKNPRSAGARVSVVKAARDRIADLEGGALDD